jgi:hypothetical protein
VILSLLNFSFSPLSTPERSTASSPKGAKARTRIWSEQVSGAGFGASPLQRIKQRPGFQMNLEFLFDFAAS